MDRTYSVDDFRQEVAKMISLQEDLTDGDLSIIVTHLARDKKAVAYNSQVSLIYILFNRALLI